MDPKIPCQFNQKKGLIICAKWNTPQSQGENDSCGRSKHVKQGIQWRGIPIPQRATIQVPRQHSNSLSDIFFKDGRVSNC